MEVMARGLDTGSLGTPVTALKVPCMEAAERVRVGGVIVAVAVLDNVAFGVLEDDALVGMRPDAEIGSVLGGVDLGPAEVDGAAAEIEEELSRNRFIACLRRGARCQNPALHVGQHAASPRPCRATACRMPAGRPWTQ